MFQMLLDCTDLHAGLGDTVLYIKGTCNISSASQAMPTSSPGKLWTYTSRNPM
jgi:hypothetical protein